MCWTVIRWVRIGEPIVSESERVHQRLTPLGHFAVKKIAVGESHSYLLSTLREVRGVILDEPC